ncbi:MAG TPA: FAD-binding oxidoreductase [Bryobacteraceae bacterium]|nr:FAD-binding oxidoreductase [Bryobacteraceae bacterium]
MDALTNYHRNCNHLIVQFAAAKACGAPIGLRKSTSNLFRQRNRPPPAKLDVRRFHRVLSIDGEHLFADVEGMTTYEHFVRDTLTHGLLPAVVPQLKTITVGGAVSGLGIESSSFKFGLVHEGVEEMDILVGAGQIVRCSRTENADLFYGFPNSYGTLGYALRLRMKLIRASPYVRLSHTGFTHADTYFSSIAGVCEDGEADFLDGTVFSENEMYATEAHFAGHAPHLSDYTYRNIYYRSIQRKTEDWMTTQDYIWRWDTDWFWCSKHFYLQNPVVRLIATKWLLNSRTYHQIMRLSQRVIPDVSGRESVIQDIDIPLDRAAEFLDFLLHEIGITPVWICPFRSSGQAARFDLYSLHPNTSYINFGVWDTVVSKGGEGYLNRKIEVKAAALGGKKALYSRAYYDQETFWRIFNKARYDQLKKKYDAGGVFKDLYAKCVRGE